MPSWYNCKFTSYLPWLVPGWMILVAVSNAFHEIMKKTEIFRQFLNTSKFRSQPLGNFLGFLGLPLQLKVWGGPGVQEVQKNTFGKYSTEGIPK